LINIEIVYALPQQSTVKGLQLPAGSSVADALQLAQLQTEFAHLDLAGMPVGVFGKLARQDQLLKEGDRIEILRPLAADPKVARRARATPRGAKRPR
jgi:uncharacterized protein